MASSAPRSRRAVRRLEADRSWSPAAGRPDEAWRLLIGISRARWVAVALSASVALAGRPSSGATRWFFLALATVAAAYNLTVTFHEHLPHWGVGTMTAITLAGDFLWVTAAALPTISERNWTAIIGYVVVGLECGLLLGAQRRELLAQSASLAHHERTDHLTGLGNSCAFDEAVASLRERPYGLLLINVDDTRWTNHVYGPPRGSGPRP